MSRILIAKEELQRRRSELLTELCEMPESFERLCSIAHRFGEIYAEEDILDNPQYARSGLWRMN